MNTRQRLRGVVAQIDDFVALCTRLASEEGPPPWSVADTPGLAGLERWGTGLARDDHAIGVCALVVAAQHGFPRILAAGAESEGIGFRGDVMGGVSVESQLDRCARWIDRPGTRTRRDVEVGFDRTRQMFVWSPDLQPTDARSWLWFYEVGQLASAAILKDVGLSNFYWAADVNVGRGLVTVARGLRREGADVAAILRDIHAAMAA